MQKKSLVEKKKEEKREEDEEEDIFGMPAVRLVISCLPGGRGRSLSW